MEYRQPPFYHFNDDSTWLCQSVVSTLKDREINNMLDLGSGCGIIGLEILKSLSSIKNISFVERQTDFIPSLKENISRSDLKSSKVFHANIKELKLDDKFDLIVSNPPYFKAGHGRVANDKRKQICRTFEDIDLNYWYSWAMDHLAVKGIFFFLVHQSNSDHKILLSQSNVECIETKADCLLLKALHK